MLSVLREVSVRQASGRELVVIGHEPREVGEVLTLETLVNGKLASTAVRVVTSIPVVQSGMLFHELRLVRVSDDIGGRRGDSMILGRDGQRIERESLATLTRHIRVRVLNCSAEGCLLETTGPLPVGTVGTLRVNFSGHSFDDAIQVVRCDRFAGTDTVHHVGVKFLSTTPPYAGTLRYTMLCDVGGLAGWLDTTVEQ